LKSNNEIINYTEGICMTNMTYDLWLHRPGEVFII